MSLSYVKIFCDLSYALEELDDGECGRLFRAILAYAGGGEMPELTGQERVVFPILRGQIDRDIRVYETRSELMKNGREKRTVSARSMDGADACEGGKEEIGIGGPGGGIRDAQPAQEKERTKEKENNNKDKEKEKEKEKEKDKKRDKLTQTTRVYAHASPPGMTAVMLYFRDVLGLKRPTREAEKFVAYNEVTGWRTLPDWKKAADLWAARIYDFGGIGDGIEDALDEYDAMRRRYAE